MHIKIAVTISIMLLLTGCQRHTTDGLLPQPLPLGADISTFTPPAYTEKDEMPPEPTPLRTRIEDPNTTITLSDALAMALLDNPRLKSHSWQVRADQAAQLQASLRPNPQLSFQIEDFGGSGTLRRFEGYETTLTVTQLIEVADKRQKRTHVAELEKLIASSQYETKRLEIFTDVINAYTDLLSAQQRLELDAQLLELSEQIVESVSGRVEAGADPPLDLIKARIVIANLKIFHRQILNQLQSARTELASLWAAAPVFKNAEGHLQLPKDIPPLENLTPYLTDNPEITTARFEVKRAQAAHRLEKARGKQDLTLISGVKRVEQNNSNAVLIGFSIPIGISNRNQGNRMAALYNYSRALEQERATRTRISADLAKRYAKMSNAYIQALEIEEKIIPAAKKVFEASKTSYQLGKIGYLDLLDSQRTYFRSRADLVTALAEFHKAKAEVEKLIARPILNRNVERKRHDNLQTQ